MHIGSRYFAFPVCPNKSRVIMPLQVVGAVPFRPVASSHFVAAPWQQSSDDAGYLPSAMTIAALSKSCVKAIDPLLPYAPYQLDKMYAYGLRKLGGLWSGNNFRTYEEAIDRLTLSKSAGYPYYYNTIDKNDALLQFGSQIRQEVAGVIAGQEMWLPFTLTLKDELRTSDRVLAQKTRGFNASGIVHLLASKQLFGAQNDKLIDTLGQHPITIGVGVPGPTFVSTVLALGNKRNCYDADGDGFDQRFNLGVARVIRELRKAFLPPQYHDSVDLLYDAVYAGDVIACGVVHRMLHNKSGWECTGHDNSLYLWLALYEAITTLTNQEFDSVCIPKINGDDLALSIDHPDIGIRQVRDYLAQYNVLIAYDNSEPRFAEDIIFLSHHLRERFIKGIGDVVVTAGNRAKLRSSVNWVRTSCLFSFEESCVLHLLGLRICLWPWEIDFLELEERIDTYIDSIVLTPRIREMLSARISERQICDLHFRWESTLFFGLLSGCSGAFEYLNGIISEFSNTLFETQCLLNQQKPNVQRSLRVIRL